MKILKSRAVDQFVGVNLADIEALKLSLDLMSVINGGKIQINTIGLVTPKFHVIVLKDGTANYDIAKATEEGEEEISEELEEEGQWIQMAVLALD